jgi:hypothetical protein
MQRRGAMSDFTQIIDEELRVSAEDFPADRDDEMAWHFTDKDIRGLPVRVAERVEETMFDPHAVASVIATIGHERDEWKKKHEQLLGPTDRLLDTQRRLLDETEEKLRKSERENMRLVVEMDELRQNIQDQAEIIERYEAPPQ